MLPTRLSKMPRSELVYVVFVSIVQPSNDFDSKLYAVPFCMMRFMPELANASSGTVEK